MSGIAPVAPWLACPACGAGLTIDGSRLLCASGHSFDIARQGYVNLMQHRPPRSADTPEMVAARGRLLRAGHFDPLADEVARRVGGSRIVEVGAGPGFYLGSALDHLPSAIGLATDVSPAAVRVAARAHARMGAIVADTWAGLPLRPASIDSLLCIFAPRNPTEFWRVLRPGGLLLVATPGAGHLATLRQGLGLLGIAEDKLAELGRALAGFEPIATTRVEWRLDLAAEDAIDLIMMGPNGFHTERAAMADRVGGPTTEQAMVDVSIFRKPAA